ncbi:hypothetical protein [uncultured Desulfobulbus sp.]|uniref:hypothetical protein n=1 Tax=uncultured Desulfobulbus sp. TaxID=239745 RepID=UPI0029C8DB31|nr:hypothetical protein [uncultured Desulfobulbus sp.]
MRLLYMLLICGLMMVFLVEGCSSPGDKQAHANARIFSEEMNDIIGIDIIADSGQDEIRTQLELPVEAKKAIVIDSLDLGKDEPDFSEAVSELRSMIRKSSNKYLCLIPKIWLRIRFQGDNYARYCMYVPNDDYLRFEFIGPVDMKSEKRDEWKQEGFSIKPNKKFSEIINRYIPEDRK